MTELTKKFRSVTDGKQKMRGENVVMRSLKMYKLLQKGHAVAQFVVALR
jgi:hypothetical protein